MKGVTCSGFEEAAIFREAALKGHPYIVTSSRGSIAASYSSIDDAKKARSACWPAHCFTLCEHCHKWVDGLWSFRICRDCIEKVVALIQSFDKT